VRRWVQPDLHFKSAHEWALWTPELDFPRRVPLPPNVRYVGPSVDVSRTETAAPARTHGTRHLVYVAVGTVKFRWRDNVPFLQKVVRAFDGVAEVQVVISTGDERATRALGETPSNIQVFDFLPQLRTIEMADLVITHAGAGTYRECVSKAVPMLAYPRNHDQIGNAARIAFHQIGLRGDRGSDSVSAIRAKALRLLQNHDCRDRLRRLRTAVRNSEERLLDEALEALLRDDRQVSR
jgi:MGT family glycosyltransferase